jgi:Flp pilus assembly protein TadD
VHRGRAAANFLGLATLCAVAMLAVYRATPSDVTAPLSAESQRLYEIGRFHWNLRGTGLAESVRDFTAVVHRDPRNPLGYAGLADAYLGLYDYPCDDRGCSDDATKSQQNARRAVEVGPHSAAAHTSLAMTFHVFVHDDVHADAEFVRAIAFDPRYALAHEWYGNSLLQRGRLHAARLELETARTLDPTSPATYAWLARDAYYERRFEDAIRLAHEALSLAPDRFETRVLRALALEQAGHVRAAIEALGSAGAEHAQLRCLLAVAYAREGNRRAATALLDANTLRAAVRLGFADDAALALVSVGDADRALRLVRARSEDGMHRAFLALDPRLDAVRGDYRFRPYTRIE